VNDMKWEIGPMHLFDQQSSCTGVFYKDII